MATTSENTYIECICSCKKRTFTNTDCSRSNRHATKYKSQTLNTSTSKRGRRVHVVIRTHRKSYSLRKSGLIESIIDGEKKYI